MHIHIYKDMPHERTFEHVTLQELRAQRLAQQTQAGAGQDAPMPGTPSVIPPTAGENALVPQNLNGPGSKSPSVVPPTPENALVPKNLDGPGLASPSVVPPTPDTTPVPQKTNDITERHAATPVATPVRSSGHQLPPRAQDGDDANDDDSRLQKVTCLQILTCKLYTCICIYIYICILDTCTCTCIYIHTRISTRIYIYISC